MNSRPWWDANILIKILCILVQKVEVCFFLRWFKTSSRWGFVLQSVAVIIKDKNTVYKCNKTTILESSVCTMSDVHALVKAPLRCFTSHRGSRGAWRWTMQLIWQSCNTAFLFFFFFSCKPSTLASDVVCGVFGGKVTEILLCFLLPYRAPFVEIWNRILQDSKKVWGQVGSCFQLSEMFKHKHECDILCS